MPIIRSIGHGQAVQRRQNIRPGQISIEFEGKSPSPADLPISDLFVGDLTIRYAVDGQKFMTNVPASRLPALGLKREELLAFSVQNLHTRYPDARVERADGFGMVVRCGDLESSWMLDFAFWEEEAKRFKGELVASVPARDVMVWADSAKPDVLNRIRETGLGVHAKAVATNRAISTLLYVWRDHAWEVYGAR